MNGEMDAGDKPVSFTHRSRRLRGLCSFPGIVAGTAWDTPASLVASSDLEVQKLFLGADEGHIPGLRSRSWQLWEEQFYESSTETMPAGWGACHKLDWSCLPCLGGHGYRNNSPGLDAVGPLED